MALLSVRHEAPINMREAPSGMLVTKVVNGYGKFTQPKTDSFGPNMIGCSISSDRQSIPGTMKLKTNLALLRISGDVM